MSHLVYVLDLEEGEDPIDAHIMLQEAVSLLELLGRNFYEDMEDSTGLRRRQLADGLDVVCSHIKALSEAIQAMA